MPRLGRRLLVLSLGVVAGAALIGVAIAADWRGDPDASTPDVVVGPGRPTPEGSPTASPETDHPALARSLPELSRLYLVAFALSDLAPETTRYRAAIEARDAGDDDLARELFAHAADAGGHLAGMANLRLAQLLAANGDHEAAIAPFTAARADFDLPDAVRAIALTEAAASLAALDRGAEAIPLLDAAAALPGITDFDRAATLWSAAQVRRDLDDPTWSDVAIEAMATEPTSEAALEALDALVAAGIQPPLMTAAQVSYRHRRDEDATALYEEALASGSLTADEIGTAWFYLGALAEREEDREGAIEAYALSLDAAPNGPRAPDARYWRGRVLEELDDPAGAAAEYDRLLIDYPTSTFAEDARIRAALTLAFAGAPADALARFEAIAADAHPVRAAEAARWHQVIRAEFALEGAEVLDPDAYHPAVLLSLLDDETMSPLPESAVTEMPAQVTLAPADIEEIEAWLADRDGPRDPAAPPILDDRAVQLGFALAAAGEPAVARTVLFAAVSDHARQPHALLDLALEAQDRGIYDVSMGIATRLLGSTTAYERIEAPRGLLLLAYPAPYLDELAAAIEEFPTPPLLLLAVMRQESHFNPQAESPVGALGLTQVMPSTGEHIAGILDEPFTAESLSDPRTSLRYGAWYLADQLDAFDGNILAVISAYNGGPASAARWLENQPFEGPDGFIHGIDFTQTRVYLENVVENYAWYRYLYAGVPMPALR